MSYGKKVKYGTHIRFFHFILAYFFFVSVRFMGRSPSVIRVYNNRKITDKDHGYTCSLIVKICFFLFHTSVINVKIFNFYFPMLENLNKRERKGALVKFRRDFVQTHKDPRKPPPKDTLTTRQKHAQLRDTQRRKTLSVKSEHGAKPITQTESRRTSTYFRPTSRTS